MFTNTAKSYKFSVSYDTSSDVFLFHSTTCTKFCCNNLVMHFSQQMVIFNLLSFALSSIGKHSFQKTRKQDRQARCFMQVKYSWLKQGSYNYPKAPPQQECSCYN